MKNFKIETAYNSIALRYRDGLLELRSHDDALQSVINLEQPQRLELRNLEHLVSVLLFIPEPKRVLMLGTAAGSLLHFLRHHYPQAEITTVDIDTVLVERMQQLGILPPADDLLEYVLADAADFIQGCDRSFDLVVFDIFNGAQSPAWLMARPIIERMYSLVSESGAVACNLLIESDHDFSRFYRDFREVFAQRCLNMPVAGLENRIVLGVRAATQENDMSGNMEEALRLSQKLGFDLMPILSVIYNTNPAGRGLI